MVVLVSLAEKMYDVHLRSFATTREKVKVVLVTSEICSFAGARYHTLVCRHCPLVSQATLQWTRLPLSPRLMNAFLCASTVLLLSLSAKLFQRPPHPLHAFVFEHGRSLLFTFGG